MNKSPNEVQHFNLTENSFWNHILESGGIYVIHLYDKEIPKKINRILGIDEEGILYMGKSENIRERLRMLFRVINPKLKTTVHTLGSKYNANKLLREKFPLHSLCISYRISKDPKIFESKFLDICFAKFGEISPFNSSK